MALNIRSVTRTMTQGFKGLNPTHSHPSSVCINR